jgi:hypothetical protein
MKDLVLEAVKAFPVWQQWATNILYSPENTLLAKPYKEMYAFGKIRDEWLRGEPGTDFVAEDGSWFSMKSRAFYGVCTREQHIRKRDELFEGAPEDAEFISLENADNYQAWWKKKGSQLFIICEEGDIYAWEDSDISDENRLIPRPTPEELSYIAEIDAADTSDGAEWAPKVDVKCLGNIIDLETQTYSYVEVIPLRDLGSEWVVQVGEGGRPSYCDEFKPLKTEAEKKREHLIRLIIKDSSIESEDGSCIMMLDRASAERLIDNGWEPQND